MNDDTPWKILCARRGFEVEERDEIMSTSANVRTRGRLPDSSGPFASVRNLWAPPPLEDSASDGAYD